MYIFQYEWFSKKSEKLIPACLVNTCIYYYNFNLKNVLPMSNTVHILNINDQIIPILEDSSNEKPIVEDSLDSFSCHSASLQPAN